MATSDDNPLLAYLQPADGGFGVSDALGAIGAGLLSGNRYQPIGPGFSQYMQGLDKRIDARQSKGALISVLRGYGFSQEEATTLAANPQAAELAIAQKTTAANAATTQRAIAGAPSLGGLFGGGGAAPGGPAAGASLNGSPGTQIPGSLTLDNNNVDTAVRTVLAEAGSQGDEGMKAVAGVLRNRALLAGTNVATEALRRNQFEPWNPDSGNDPRRFKQDSPEYQRALAAVLPVLKGEAADPTGGATHFYAPKAQAALGRKAPSWDDGNGSDIGDHRFFRLPFMGKDPAALAQRQAPVQVAAGPRDPAVADDGDGGPVVPGGDRPPVAQAPRPPVQIANTEAETQALESRMAASQGVPGPARSAPTAPAGGTAVAQADVPAPGAQQAGFYVPGSAAEAARAAGLPPAAPRSPEGFNGSTARNLASRHYEYWSKVLAASGSNKGLGELAKSQMDVSREYLKPDQIETKLDAAGITGAQRSAIIRNSIPDSRPSGVQEYEYGRQDPGYEAYQDRRKDAGGSKITADIEARKTAAEAMGLKPGSPAYQSYVLTAKMPREDQQPLSASDKKAILEADEAVASNQTVMGNLKQAMELSKQAFSGPLAPYLGMAGSWVNSDRGKATVEYDNLITTNALAQLKSIFGAAPTEGERKILLDIQGSSSQSQAVRDAILQRAYAAAERRLTMNQQRATEMRGGSYFRPEGGPAASRSGTPPTSQQQAPAFSADELAAEARRRGLVQ